MSYLWDDFNIKTFPAQTVVFRDGVFCPDLSTIEDIADNTIIIDKKIAQPVHIIYVGEIRGDTALKIHISAPDQPVFLSAKIKNNFPAFFNIFVKNTGKNSELRGHITTQNNATLKLNIDAHHDAPKTGVLINTKLIAGPGSESEISGVATITKNGADAVSDLSFAAIAAQDAKIKFTPAQKISAVPESAEHGAAIYHPAAPQIQFLRNAGITERDAEQILRDAFLDDNPLF